MEDGIYRIKNTQKHIIVCYGKPTWYNWNALQGSRETILLTDLEKVSDFKLK